MGYASVQAHALLLCVLRVQCEMCALLTACSFESLLSYYTYWYMNVHCSELRWIKRQFYYKEVAVSREKAVFVNLD